MSTSPLSRPLLLPEVESNGGCVSPTVGQRWHHWVGELCDRLAEFAAQHPEIEAVLHQLQALEPQLDDLQALVAGVQHRSHLLFALIELSTFQVRSLNQQFQDRLGVIPTADAPFSGWELFHLLSQSDQMAVGQLFRRHLLLAILRQQYGYDSPTLPRLLEEAVVVTVPPQGDRAAIKAQLWLRSDRLRLTLTPDLAATLEAEWQRIVADQSRPDSRLAPLTIDQIDALTSHLNVGQYQASGWLLVEGVDVTAQDATRRLTQLLIDGESVLAPRKFYRVDKLVRSLFQADQSLILTAEYQQAQLFMGLRRQALNTITFDMAVLQESYFLRAALENQVITVPDLAVDAPTPGEQAVRDAGARSLLIIPIVVRSQAEAEPTPAHSRLMGVIGLTSANPYQFDAIDRDRALALIPAFAAALQQGIQRRFNHIHPSVEWRFVQEAERRSWGLPPEPIGFTDVYPLYGISDIRGSSQERNAAIQQDLLTQFRLAAAVLHAVNQATDQALARQLYQDLLVSIQQIEQGITVEAEVTLTRYLQQHIERHFHYFQTCSSETAAAIAAYRDACDATHHCVYTARAAYDRTIHHINNRLRETWNRWQASMQRVVQHYCDIEMTDGIDHMMYVGASIDSQFCEYHLYSLRYDQLQAVCDCARVSFQLKAQLATPLEITHLVLVQASTVDISHDEHTERLFDVQGTRDTRYEIVKKRIDKALDQATQERITQPGMLTIVYSTPDEKDEYNQYLRYLRRDGWIGDEVVYGDVEPLQGVTGLKFIRVPVLPAASLG